MTTGREADPGDLLADPNGRDGFRPGRVLAGKSGRKWREKEFTPSFDGGI
jgi:hypothetical protein